MCLWHKISFSDLLYLRFLNIQEVHKELKFRETQVKRVPYFLFMLFTT